MHEVAIAENIINIARSEAEKGGWRKINRISVKVGKLTALVPECLHFAFENIAKDTPAADAALEIEEVEAKAKCRSCGAEFTVDSFFCICEACGSQDIEISGGEELTITNMDVE